MSPKQINCNFLTFRKIPTVQLQDKDSGIPALHVKICLKTFKRSRKGLSVYICTSVL